MLAVVDQWPDFVEGVICSVIMAWHLLRIIEMEIAIQSLKALSWKYRLYSWISVVRVSRPVVWNGRLLVDPHNNVDTKKGFDLLRCCWVPLIVRPLN